MMGTSPQDSLALPATSTFDDNDSTEESKPADPFNKSIVGGHRGLALYKKGGLVKKTISVAGLHMISYYDPTDIANGRLQTPTSVPELANLDIDQCFLKAKYFRHPPQVTIDEEGLPRFAGLTDEEPMVRKPPSQQRKNVSEATALANKAIYYGVPASIPGDDTPDDDTEARTSPILAPLVSPPRTASRSSTGLVRSRTSASSTSATTASQSPNMTPRRTSTSSVRPGPYRVPSMRQSQTISGSVDLPPGFVRNTRPMTSDQAATIYSRRNPHQRSISLSEVYQSPLLPRAEGAHHQQHSARPTLHTLRRCLRSQRENRDHSLRQHPFRVYRAPLTRHSPRTNTGQAKLECNTIPVPYLYQRCDIRVQCPYRSLRRSILLGHTISSSILRIIRTQSLRLGLRSHTDSRLCSVPKRNQPPILILTNSCRIQQGSCTNHSRNIQLQPLCIASSQIYRLGIWQPQRPITQTLEQLRPTRTFRRDLSQCISVQAQMRCMAWKGETIIRPARCVLTCHKQITLP